MTKSTGIRHAVRTDAPAAKRFSPKGLRSHRIRLGLSLPQAAKLLNVSAPTVNNWEQGKTRPRPEQFGSIIALRAMTKRAAAAVLEQGEA